MQRLEGRHLPRLGYILGQGTRRLADDLRLTSGLC